MRVGKPDHMFSLTSWLYNDLFFLKKNLPDVALISTFINMLMQKATMRLCRARVCLVSVIKPHFHHPTFGCAGNSKALCSGTEECVRPQRRLTRWHHRLFTWLGVRDNPNVATSQGETGDFFHLPSAKGRQSHSVKLEVFALKLDRCARRVCLALRHRRLGPPVPKQQSCTLARTAFISVKVKAADEKCSGDFNFLAALLRDAEARYRGGLQPISLERSDVIARGPRIRTSMCALTTRKRVINAANMQRERQRDRDRNRESQV